ncbi:heme-binding protein 2-like [Ambystoma mexicanum]|uniref:heme-binding protein 2-like n=1 Tax=Ambystoma mexicanum TaxID=8296 RepID=UPI0037E93273
MYFACALLLLYVVSSSSSKPDDTGHGSPRFCRSRDCPKYELVKQYSTFEERHYEASRWVSTDIGMESYSSAIMHGFWRLFHYISGKNAEGKKIPMTVPVLVHVLPDGKGLSPNITMSFFVPFAEEKPPTPNDTALYLTSLPVQTVYVKSFGGFAFKSDYIDKAKSLSEELKALGKAFKEDSFLTAGYDAPFMLINRHNEVWYIAE